MSNLPLISVVDDDTSVCEHLQCLIRSFGFAVEELASAEEFLNSGHLPNTLCMILDVRNRSRRAEEGSRAMVIAYATRAIALDVQNAFVEVLLTRFC